MAQPFRFVGHNGEINTISANRRWLRAKAPAVRQELGLSDQVRLLEERVSDSASFDNGLEIFLRRGYSPAETMLSMVPPAWERSPEAAPEFELSLKSRPACRKHGTVRRHWFLPTGALLARSLTAMGCDLCATP